MILEFFRELIQLMNEHAFEKKRCLSCEELRRILDEERKEKRKLLDFVLSFDNENVKEEKELPVPIMPKTIPWRVQRELLEAEDRKRAQLMKETEKLEKELLEKER